MTLRVTQTRSSIGTKPKQRGTLRALGLRRLGQSNDLPDRPEIRGMLAKVPHLIEVVDLDDASTDASPAEASAEGNPAGSVPEGSNAATDEETS